MGNSRRSLWYGLFRRSSFVVSVKLLESSTQLLTAHFGLSPRLQTLLKRDTHTHTHTHTHCLALSGDDTLQRLLRATLEILVLIIKLCTSFRVCPREINLLMHLRCVFNENLACSRFLCHPLLLGLLLVIRFPLCHCNKGRSL